MVAGGRMIPRRLHRIWLGPWRMPEEYVAHARTWESLGWTVHDWTAQDLPRLPISDETRAALADIEANGTSAGGGDERVARWVQMADVWSYELVRHVGGVYANCDVEPLRDLPLDGLDAFVVAESGQFLSNALMGAVAGHPFFAEVSLRLPGHFADNRWVEMNRSTGPHLLTMVWEQFDVSARPARLEPVPFFPVGFVEERERRDDYRPPPEFYVDHHWGHKHPELLR